MLIAAMVIPLATAASAEEAPPINVDPSVSDPGYVEPNPNPMQRRQAQNRSSEAACFDYTEGGETYTACSTKTGSRPQRATSASRTT
jgi:hypothetical protein